MAHVRKEIRRVLNDMGFDNRFLISGESLLMHDRGEPLVVAIKDWEPHPDALKLKSRLRSCTDGRMDICFLMSRADGGSAE